MSVYERIIAGGSELFPVSAVQGIPQLCAVAPVPIVIDTLWPAIGVTPSSSKVLVRSGNILTETGWA